MTTATIRLLDFSRMRDKPFASGDKQVAYAKAMLALNAYEQTFDVETDQLGERAADAMFDLTNNPSRQYERVVKYGRHRSLSSGDIVTVDGVDYLWLSIGGARL